LQQCFQRILELLIQLQQTDEQILETGDPLQQTDQSMLQRLQQKVVRQCRSQQQVNQAKQLPMADGSVSFSAFSRAPDLTVTHLKKGYC
jgi:hypothetical protein